MGVFDFFKGAKPEIVAYGKMRLEPLKGHIFRCFTDDHQETLDYVLREQTKIKAIIIRVFSSDAYRQVTSINLYKSLQDKKIEIPVFLVTEAGDQAKPEITSKFQPENYSLFCNGLDAAFKTALIDALKLNARAEE